MTPRTAALAAICSLAPHFGAARADDGPAAERLPEPTLRFAKDATLRIMEAERGWLKLGDGLAKAGAGFATATGSPCDQAVRHLAGAKRLLEDQTRMETEFARFNGLLAKAAAHYRAVSALYSSHAGEARSPEVRDDYRTLAEHYEAKAVAAEGRAKALALPARAKETAAVIEEGNTLLERLLDTLPDATAGDAAVGPLADRLKTHGDRCQSHCGALVRAIETLLESAEAADVRDAIAVRRAEVATGRSATPGTGGKAATAPKRDLGILAGATWTAPITIEGVRCLQVLRFSPEGTCSQSLYRRGVNGRGPLVSSSRVTCEWDADGTLDVSQAGWVIERGRLTLRGKDEWTYEILASAGNPALAGTTLTFTREGRTTTDRKGGR